LVRLLTVPETAKLMRMSRSGVMGLIRRGQLPFVEVPGPNPRRAGRLLVDEEDLLEHVKGKWRNGKTE